MNEKSNICSIKWTINMRFHKILEDLFSSRVKIAVMKILFFYPDKKFSGRELARLIKISPSRTSEVLELFRRYGIINRIKIGNTCEWSLNKENILVKELSKIFKIDEKVYKTLKTKIYNILKNEKKILKVILYGSIARGDEKPDSDIDLFILVKNKKDKEKVGDLISKLNFSLIPIFGNVISEFIYSEEELKTKTKSKILSRIYSEGDVILDRKK